MKDANGNGLGGFSQLPDPVDKSPPSEQDDSSRWELDTNPFLDRVYHELLGQSLNEDSGVWVDDPKKPMVMNELGAAEFIAEISTRVSIHMQLSDLGDQDIIGIASFAAEIFGDKLEDNWGVWEIRPTEANLNSIATRLYDVLYISLRIARHGGMKRHRERFKAPRIQMPLPPEVEGGL